MYCEGVLYSVDLCFPLRTSSDVDYARGYLLVSRRTAVLTRQAVSSSGASGSPGSPSQRFTLPPLRRSSARHECICDLLRHPRNDLCLEYEGQRGDSRPLSPSSFLILIRDKADPARPYIVWLSPTVG